MARVAPLERCELAEFEDFFKIVDQVMGFLPNSMLTLGRRPEILRGFTALTGAVLGPGKLSPELKQLVAFVSSNASGCRYCRRTPQPARAGWVPPPRRSPPPSSLTRTRSSAMRSAPR